MTAAQYGKGWKPDLNEHIVQTPVFGGLYAAQKLGAVRTPREHTSLPDYCFVRDQDGSSACVGFGLTGAAYCRLHAIGVPCGLFSPTALYNLTLMASRPNKSDPLIDDGCYPFVAASILVDHGLCQESAYPFSMKRVAKEVDLQTVLTSSQFRVSNFSRITARGEERVEVCKRSIAASHPVPLGMLVGDEFQAYTSSRDPVGIETGPDTGGHMTFLCGYENDGEVFIGCNSWGKSWGDQGFFRIHRSKLEHSSTTDLYEIVITEK